MLDILVARSSHVIQSISKTDYPTDTLILLLARIRVYTSLYTGEL